MEDLSKAGICRPLRVPAGTVAYRFSPGTTWIIQ